MLDKILFIVNPVSGKKRNIDISKIIHNQLTGTNNDYKILFTQYPGHASDIVKQNHTEYKTIIAAGGDGTVNEIAQALINKNNVFGIIPVGSGNGLARSLKIPINSAKAIKTILNRKIRKIDTGKINNNNFINISGIGFDAEVAHSFNRSKKRGFSTYFNEVLNLFKSYKPVECVVKIDGNDDIITQPFLISIANSTQWGNNAYISPVSNLEDGLLEICILEKFPMAISPILAGRLFLKTIHFSPYMKIIHTEKCEIHLNDKCNGHLDGEPVVFDNILKIEVVKQSLNIISN